MATIGSVILVGAGPGDPDLITVKGLDEINQADCIVYDYLASRKLLKSARTDAELIYAGKRGGRRSLPQEEINELLVSKAKEGKRVVRLKGGDPYVFGRGGEEVEALHAAGIPFRVIPGIPAALGTAAYAGIPLTDRRYASQVTFVTGHEDPHKDENQIKWEGLAKLPGTLVIYMACYSMERATSALIQFGRPADTPASVTSWATTGNQRTVCATLGTLFKAAEEAGITAPALIIVGDVNLLRPVAAWYERLPLFGKRLVVTRSDSAKSNLRDGLAALGADLVELPVIAIEPMPDLSPLKKAVSDLSSYDWIVFTSVNGVTAFMKALDELELDARTLAPCKLVTVGKATTEALRTHGLRTDLNPKRATGKDVFDALVRTGELSGKRILMPRSEIAHSDLPELCQAAGASVDDVPSYRTVPVPFDAAEIREQLASTAIHGVTFTSTSTVRNFVEGVGLEFIREHQDRLTCLSIGPTTSGTLREYGLEPAMEAETSNVDGLIAAIVAFFSS